MLIDTLTTDYDLVIAGGGLVGGSFALMLAAGSKTLKNDSLRILLVDSAPMTTAAKEPGRPFDARSTALSWGSRLIYEWSDCWDSLAPHVTPIRHIHVSDRGHMGSTRLHSDEMGVDALGYVAENRHLNEVTAAALINSPEIHVYAPGSVAEAKPVSTGVQLRIDDRSGQPVAVHTRLLVIADGGRSGLCEQLGIVIKRKPYAQQALIANIAFEQAHDGWAYERFTDTGPLAVLPLSDLDTAHRGALVWTLDEAQVSDVMALSDEAFLARLQQRFGYRLGAITKVGERTVFPLSLNLASEQIRPGILLLGNVAHTLHPVAGQGLNLALRDARELADMVIGSCAQGRKSAIGEYAWLQIFEQRQQSDQQQTVYFSDLSTRLFSNSNTLLALGRNLGLVGMSLVPPARHWFARRAMGLRDRRTL